METMSFTTRTGVKYAVRALRYATRTPLTLIFGGFIHNIIVGLNGCLLLLVDVYEFGAQGVVRLWCILATEEEGGMSEVFRVYALVSDCWW